MQITRRLLVVYQMVDGGIASADGACVAMLHADGTELHGLCVEGEQTVGEQLSHAGEVFQRLGSLDGAQHTGNGSQYTCLRAGRNGSDRWWLLEEAAVAGRAGQMGEGLTVEAQDATVRERLTSHDAGVVDEEFHGEVVSAVDHEIVVDFSKSLGFPIIIGGESLQTATTSIKKSINIFNF